MPKSNTEFWESKITRNRRRDFIATSMLEALSWNVITIWECELSPRKFTETMDKVESLLATNRKAWEEYRNRRRADREFAMAERRRQKEVEKIKEDELQGMYHIPQSIIRLSRNEPE